MLSLPSLSVVVVNLPLLCPHHRLEPHAKTFMATYFCGCLVFIHAHGMMRNHFATCSFNSTQNTSRRMQTHAHIDRETRSSPSPPARSDPFWFFSGSLGFFSIVAPLPCRDHRMQGKALIRRCRPRYPPTVPGINKYRPVWIS